MLEVLCVNVEQGIAFCVEIGTSDGECLCVGYHAPSVVKNGWEPYDQPSPAAYMPRSLRETLVEELPNGGRVLVQKGPRDASLKPTKSSVRSEIETAVRRTGAPFNVADIAMNLLRRKLAS